MGIKRSIIRTSKGNYMVTVPKFWVEVLLMKYGAVDGVVVDVAQDDSLILRPIVRR